MQYRTLGRTGMKVSEIGLGCEHLQGQDQKNVEAVISSALDHEINIMDVFMSEPQVRSNIGTALQGKRDRFMIQGHIGAAWLDGQYCRTRDMGHCQAFFEDLLTRLETDYIDIGMLHFVDTQEDFDGTFHTGLIEYALNLKEKGKIRALGMSSHNPVIAAKAVETGWIDVLMFSLNPAYDLLPEETDVDHLFMPETFRQQGLAG